GMFQFTGVHGASLEVAVKKDGYEIGARGEGYKGPVGEKTSPTDRAILTMWKLRGAEPMIHRAIDSHIPYDGTAAMLDLAAGKKVADGSGDLRITLRRTPLQIAPGLSHPYNWDVKIETINGHILEENDPYPYWAPEN